MQEPLEMCVRPVDWEDPLEEEDNSSILARKIPWTEEPGTRQLQELDMTDLEHTHGYNT